MFLHKDKKWWDCAIARAERTVAQTLVSMLPVGMVITPTMMQDIGVNLVYVIGAWILTGLFGGLASILTSYAKGLPEVEE